MTPYTREQLIAFATCARVSKDPTERAAAIAIGEALRGVDIAAKLGAKRKRGQRKKIHDPALITIDHPVFAIAMHRVLGKITYDEALEEIGTEMRCGRSTADTLLRAVRPRAEQTLNAVAVGLPDPKKIGDLFV